MSEGKGNLWGYKRVCRSRREWQYEVVKGMRGVREVRRVEEI